MNKRLLNGMALFLVVCLVVLHTPAKGFMSATGEGSWIAGTEWDVAPQQSTTGPYPPLEVLLWDMQKDLSVPQETKGEVVLNVPAYYWRHGCGPTALSMVVGYYDTKGYGDLIPGDAWMQTAAVNQMIASGGDWGNPFPPGSEGHFEDYASPRDSVSGLLQDDYITAGRDPHPHNSIADYVETSWSTRGNPYGWSWSTKLGSSFVDYFDQQYPEAVGVADSTTYYPMTWEVLVNEINAGRPMVFLVDTSGDGVTDHFVTAIGYRTSPTLQYAMRDTWSNYYVRWENFAQIAAGTRWGIYAGWSYQLSHPPADVALSNQTVVENLPVGSQVGTFSTTDPLLGDIITYSFVTGSGDNDNGLFNIVGNQLLTTTTIDYETRTGYSVRVRSTDSNGDWVEKSFAITVSNVNEPPTNLTLTEVNLDEQIPAGSEIGQFSTQDEDMGEAFVYTLDSSAGAADNASFLIAGDRLISAEEIDFGQQAQYSILVRSTDGGGLFIQKFFIISIDGVGNTFINRLYMPMLVR